MRYDVEDMVDGLESAIRHLTNAEDELLGMVEFEGEVADIIGIRKQLEQLLEEANDILQKQLDDEQKALENSLDKLRM